MVVGRQVAGWSSMYGGGASADGLHLVTLRHIDGPYLDMRMSTDGLYLVTLRHVDGPYFLGWRAILG